MDERGSAPSEHRHTWDAIPWIVNGHASEAELATARAHLQGCADCRAELEFQTRLRDGMRADPSEARDPQAPLTRLWARIDRVEGEGDAFTPPRRAANAPNWNRMLAAAVVVQAIGLVTLAGLIWGRSAPADYQTLSRPATSVPGAALRLVPAPDLSIGALRALLQNSGVEIAQSNVDASILTLRLRSSAGADVAQALAHLRAVPGVLLAEPIDTTAANEVSR